MLSDAISIASEQGRAPAAVLRDERARLLTHERYEVGMGMKIIAIDDALAKMSDGLS